MLFPDSPRVIYEKTPLAEVIAQVRFSPILRITTEPPSQFQEGIRRDYPVYREQSGLPAGIELPAELVKLVNPDQRGRHQFATPDEKWTISLSREALTLTTHSYLRWEDFRKRLELVLKNFLSIYAPAFYTRIGLRYRDIIKRSDLGLQDKDWSELLEPHIAGEFSRAYLRGAITGVQRKAWITLPELSGRVYIQHGTVFIEGNPEVCYLIDADFSSEGQLETQYAIETLSKFNKLSGRLFRSCITPVLHEAMGPKDASTS